MSKPSSFCTMCTENCSAELIGLLLSLSIYHRNENIYILSDSKTREIIQLITPQPKLNITWFVELDKYNGLSRNDMVNNNTWSEFQMSKAAIIKKTLEKEEDTIYLDCDVIIVSEFNDIDKTKELGVSPHFLSKKCTDEVGFYNGGMLWCKNKSIPDDWVHFTKTSRYYDQASIEDLSRKYSYFEFDENYNLTNWRLLDNNNGTNMVNQFRLDVIDNIICYNEKPLKSIHTHFVMSRQSGNYEAYTEFNKKIIDILKTNKMFKLLAIIYRIIHNKWILKIPNQPISGMFYHTNDSYRELVKLLSDNNNDVEIKNDSSVLNCWLEPTILMYDRDKIQWFYEDNTVKTSSLILLGNGNIDDEGQAMNNMFPKIPVKNWIFWPRAPTLLEKILENNGILNYENRLVESIFIGNYENSVQEEFRKTSVDWKSVVSEFYLTAGHTKLFTHEEYLMKLRSSKFGLCLRGYGSKCHREVELMAFGTVPIITKNVSLSYLDKLIENEHYIYVENEHDLTIKIKNITQEKWEQMSKKCYEWYDRNVHSKNCWKTTINNILYEF